jgi:hypothetical protein
MPDQVCRYDSIKYGNYIFNTFSKVTLNKQNIYSEDGLIVKYVRCTLEVDFIVTNETVTVTNPLVKSVDAEMDKIHEELQAPNKELKIFYHGMGEDISIIGRAVTNEVGVNNAPRSIPFNILEGPFPEVVTWEPLAGNNAVRCKWRCVFNMATGPVKMYANGATPETSNIESNKLGGGVIGDITVSNDARSYAGLQSLPDLVNNYIRTIFDISPEQSDPNQMLNCLLSHTEEQEFEIEEDGTAVMTLTGELEFVSSGALVNRLKETPAAIPRLLQLITHYFEPLHPVGFTRTQKYKFKKNKRSIEYTIVDREIKSDNPIMPNILKADVSHSVSSNLVGGDEFDGTGFLTWNNVFEGSFTVRPGVWKGWAWLAMMTIVRQRMAQTLPFTGEAKLGAKDAISGALQDGAIDADRRHLLHYISIKENIYTRECSFNLKYLVVTNLNQLFVSTGLFYPVAIAWQGQNLPADLGKVPVEVNGTTVTLTTAMQSYANQWGISREYMANAQNVFGYRGPLLPGYDMVFNPYDGWDTNRFENPTAPRNPERSIVSSNSTVNFTAPNNYNTVTLAERRRNAHLDTFTNLAFPTPENVSQQWGGNSPVKEVPGLPRSFYNTSPYKSHNAAQDSAYLKNVDPKETWLSYDTKFILRRNENSVMFPSIKSQLPSSRQSTEVGSATLRNYTGSTIVGNGAAEPNVSDYVYDDIQAFGNPTTYVQFTGQAMRVGYPIPCPVLVGCKNAGIGGGEGTVIVPAFRVGESQYTCYQVNKSADIPVFRAVWNVVYALKGDPACANIKYQANRSNYYA